MDHTSNIVGIFDRYAKQYSEKFGDVSLYADALQQFLDLLDNNASVLELACGPGNVTRYLLDRKPDLRILATDLAPKMIEIAKELNPEVEFMLLDSRAIASIQQNYDGIMCSFCLPYLTNDETQKFIGDCYTTLKDNGALYLSTMEDDPCKSGIHTSPAGNTMFMNYYESRFLTGSLESSGFKIVKLIRKTYSTDGRPVTDLLIVAEKHAPGNPQE
jgi:SAM-dependent methyltransferase